jgi:hypothetical protein
MTVEIPFVISGLNIGTWLADRPGPNPFLWLFPDYFSVIAATPTVARRRDNKMVADLPRKNRAPQGTRFQCAGVGADNIVQRGTCCAPASLGGYIRRFSWLNMRRSQPRNNAGHRMSAMSKFELRQRLAAAGACGT